MDEVEEAEKCHNVIDIAFLVDSSHSVKGHYSKELQFVQKIANRYDADRG